MQQYKRDELIFWRDTPVDVERGAFEYISDHWGNKVKFISCGGYSKERAQCQWGNNNLEEIILEGQDNSEKYVKDLFNKYPNAIHIFNGFRGKTKIYLKKYVENKNTKIGILAERPSYFGTKIRVSLKRIAIWSLYHFYSARYDKKIDVFLALGQKGVDTYRLLGFNGNALFPFMYNPLIGPNEKTVIEKKTNSINMLYIGRFSATFKGVDILLEAIKTIDKQNWQLDFVGGYGDFRNEVINFAKSHAHVRFKGTWKSDEVISKIKEYDLCIIPSKYDGWNLISNEAINAGVGVIITDQAGSDELVKVSGAGIVVPADNVEALSEAILKVLNNPELVQQFKKNAQIYAPRISSEVVGKYFIDVMDYTFYQKSKSRPKCPWL